MADRKTHQLKIQMDYAIAQKNGYKPWELRKNDRDFKLGDIIDFSVIDTHGNMVGAYLRRIEYIFEGGKYGLEEGYVIMTLTEI